MHHCNQPPFAENATICKNLVYLLMGAAIMDARKFTNSVACLRLTDCCCRVCLLAVGLESAMGPRNRMHVDTPRTGRPVGSAERAVARRGLPRAVLTWLAEVLPGRTADTRP